MYDSNGTFQREQEGDFVLPESAAILRYLASTHDTARQWYPPDARRRARIDAALDWQHSTVRAGEARLVRDRLAANQLKRRILLRLLCQCPIFWQGAAAIMTVALLRCQVFHSVLTRNLGGPSENDKLLWTVALDTLKLALKVQCVQVNRVDSSAFIRTPCVVNACVYDRCMGAAQALDTVWLNNSDFMAGDISIAGEHLMLLTTFDSLHMWQA